MTLYAQTLRHLLSQQTLAQSEAYFVSVWAELIRAHPVLIELNQSNKQLRFERSFLSRCQSGASPSKAGGIRVDPRHFTMALVLTTSDWSFSAEPERIVQKAHRLAPAMSSLLLSATPERVADKHTTQFGLSHAATVLTSLREKQYPYQTEHEQRCRLVESAVLGYSLHEKMRESESYCTLRSDVHFTRAFFHELNVALELALYYLVAPTMQDLNAWLTLRLLSARLLRECSDPNEAENDLSLRLTRLLYTWATQAANPEWPINYLHNLST